ncbi:MAG: aldehyde dehydrogenase family protein [Candidatus Krumholzibacteriales bacterium]
MKMLIAGKWVDRKEKIQVLDPLDNSLVDTVPSGTDEDIKLAVDAAAEGYRISRNMPVHERIRILRKVSDAIEDNAEELAETIAREGSKTINEARGEVSRAAQTILISSEEARRITGETIPFNSSPGSEKRIGYYFRFPIGIIGAITPFNDPLNLVAHKLGPAIAGGNSVVLKPATVTPLSALKLGKLFMDAGLPDNILNIVTGHGGKIGDALVTDPRVRMISFTGGVEAGEKISRKAGLKKIGMELGSNTPVIVCEDCDLEKAVGDCVSGAFWAAGQNCIGVQRIYIMEPLYKRFETLFVSRTRNYRIGPKLEEATDMGPMITEAEARRIENWVNEAVEGGARVLTGHQREGALYHPTVLANVPAGCKVDREEVFAPTVNLYPVKTLDEAIEKANDVDFGLHAGIFTSDYKKAFKAVRGLEVGGVMINDSSDFRIDMMPFGGVKKSGLGREGIKFALQEMTEPRVVCFNL